LEGLLFAINLDYQSVTIAYIFRKPAQFDYGGVGGSITSESAEYDARRRCWSDIHDWSNRLCLRSAGDKRTHCIGNYKQANPSVAKADHGIGTPWQGANWFISQYGGFIDDYAANIIRSSKI
jgi:hypothetical protein